MPENRAFQPHFTVAELAKEWRLSPSTLLRIFKSEPGVLRIGNLKTRKRTKISLRIPKDVAERVHRRLGGEGLDTNHQSVA
jgi:AraC-like DNA-binding protein